MSCIHQYVVKQATGHIIEQRQCWRCGHVSRETLLADREWPISIQSCQPSAGGFRDG